MKWILIIFILLTWAHPFTDAVEILSVEPLEPTSLETDELVFNDEENKAIKMPDGRVYLWLESFETVWMQNSSEPGYTLIYQNQLFLSIREKGESDSLDWSLNLDTGIYTQIEGSTISTFCGDVQISELITRWLIIRIENDLYLCSLYKGILSSPMPENHNWWYGVDPLLITESPDGNIIVVFGSGTFFKYEINANKFTEIGSGSFYPSPHPFWLKDKILIVYSHDQGNSSGFDPGYNIVDLRYNHVITISGSRIGTPEEDVTFVNNPPRIISKDISTIDYTTSDGVDQVTYCQETIYDIVRRIARKYYYGEFCSLLAGDRYGIGYYLRNHELWRYAPSPSIDFSSNEAQRVFDGKIDYTQPMGDNLLLYTSQGVFLFDTTTETAENLLDRPALLLVDHSQTIIYFITEEGLFRLNRETGEQRLVFAGLVSQVNWIDEERGMASLIYQVIKDNWPPYVSPLVFTIDPMDQPGYGQGNLALISLDNGKIIYETPTEWNQAEDYLPGSWETRNTIGSLGNNWFKIDSPDEFILLHLTEDGAVSTAFDSNVGFDDRVTLAEDWLLIQNDLEDSVYLFNPETGVTITIAEKVTVLWSVVYLGSSEFKITIPDEAIYHIRIPQLAH